MQNIFFYKNFFEYFLNFFLAKNIYIHNQLCIALLETPFCGTLIYWLCLFLYKNHSKFRKYWPRNPILFWNFVQLLTVFNFITFCRHFKCLLYVLQIPSFSHDMIIIEFRKILIFFVTCNKKGFGTQNKFTSMTVTFMYLCHFYYIAGNSRN